jgi:hypothetical protein
MRTTFGTMLSRTGAAPRTAQAAMRHSDIKLTVGVYTDPRLLDVRGAVEKLPTLPLASRTNTSASAVQATGTDNRSASESGRLHQLGATGSNSDRLGSTRDW